MKLLISEVIKKASNAKTKAEKIKILQENNSQALRSVLKWNFEPAIESDIPEGEVPFKRNDAPMGTEHTMLEREGRLSLTKRCFSCIPVMSELDINFFGNIFEH